MPSSPLRAARIRAAQHRQAAPVQGEGAEIGPADLSGEAHGLAPGGVQQVQAFAQFAQPHLAALIGRQGWVGEAFEADHIEGSAGRERRCSARASGKPPPCRRSGPAWPRGAQSGLGRQSGRVPSTRMKSTISITSAIAVAEGVRRVVQALLEGAFVGE